MLVASLAAEQHGVVSAPQLASRGLNREAIRVRVASGRLHRIHHGVFAVGHVGLTRDARFMAAVLACGPTAALSFFSAGALWGYLEWDDRWPEVTVVGSAGRRRPGLRIHRARALRFDEVSRRNAIPVTSPARTVLDLAATLPDSGLRRVVRQSQASGHTNVRTLLEVAERAGGHRGAGRLKTLVATGPAPTRSAKEDIVLDLLLRAGLEHPQVNAPLWIGGRRLAPDLRWPEQRLIVEVDSDTWHGGALAGEDDAERQALLEAAGERVLRVHWRQAVSRPRQTLARIVAAGAPIRR
ncbi:MAG: hypothetical protein QOI73_1959 [Solirubrobacteraceae bacterium]|nr:hypothetical protein [Solirubrobacteraceae bacterium]